MLCAVLNESQLSVAVSHESNRCEMPGSGSLESHSALCHLYSLRDRQRQTLLACWSCLTGSPGPWEGREGDSLIAEQPDFPPRSLHPPTQEALSVCPTHRQGTSRLQRSTSSRIPEQTLIGNYAQC
jgi:hypothetical protein